MTDRQTKVAGFTLLELVIVLGITGLIFGGLWGLLSGGNSQLQAQAAAKQYRQILTALNQYATSGVYASAAAGMITPAPTVQTLKTQNLLPSTVPTSGNLGVDVFGNNIYLAVNVVDAAQNKFQVMAYSDTSVSILDDKMGSQVASLIGAEGGFVYSQNTEGCTGAGFPRAVTACGAYNSFKINLTSPAYIAPVGSDYTGRIVAYGYSGDFNTGTAPYLYRKPGYTQEQRTMQDNMFFDGTSTLNMSGSDITMGVTGSNFGTLTFSDGGALFMGGANSRIHMGIGTATSGGGQLNMAAGPVSNVGSINGTGGFLSLSPSTAVIRSTGSVVINSASSIIVAPYASLPAPTIQLDITGRGRASEFQAGSFIYTSDASLKGAITPITNALEKILTLKGVNYRWKGNGSKDIGLLAQDVEGAFPEMVSTLPEGRKGIDYAKMVAPLVEAIRQLHDENQKLKGEIKAIQDQIGNRAVQQ